MKDIKITKLKINKAKEEELNSAVPVVGIRGNTIDTGTKSKSSTFSVFLFGFMSVSLIFYIFLVSSSVFYTIKSSQYDFKTEKLNREIYSANLDEIGSVGVDKNYISYISETETGAITLK